MKLKKLFLITATALGLMAERAQAGNIYLYVTDYNNGLISQFNSTTGSLVNTFSLSLPSGAGVAVNDQGNIWVNNGASNSLISPSGSVLESTVGQGPPLVSLQGAAIGPDDNLYASDLGGNAVDEYNGTTGAFISTFVPSINGPTGIAFDPANGNVFIGSNHGNAIDEYTSSGQYIKQFATIGNPNGLAFGPNGNLFAVSTGIPSYVEEFDPGTGLLIKSNFTYNNANLLYISNGLTFGPDGNLYIPTLLTTNPQTGAILEFNGTTGAYIKQFASTGLENPQDLAFTPAPVPELPVPLMLSMGMLVPVVARRVRRRRTARTSSESAFKPA